jgi:hypothetical protein
VTQREGECLLSGSKHIYRTQFRILSSWNKTPWAPPLVELAGGMAGHLLAWERHERDSSWWAWVSWVHRLVADAITRRPWCAPTVGGYVGVLPGN